MKGPEESKRKKKNAKGGKITLFNFQGKKGHFKKSAPKPKRFLGRIVRKNPHMKLAPPNSSLQTPARPNLTPDRGSQIEVLFPKNSILNFSPPPPGDKTGGVGYLWKFNLIWGNKYKMKKGFRGVFGLKSGEKRGTQKTLPPKAKSVPNFFQFTKGALELPKTIGLGNPTIFLTRVQSGKT